MTEEKPLGLGFNIPKIKRQISKDNLRNVNIGSRDAQDVVANIERSYLDRTYKGLWKIKTVYVVDNKDLEDQYRSKRQALKDEGRHARDLNEQFAFWVIKDANIIQKIAQSGLKTRSTNFNAIGDSKHGVYVCKHADIQLRLAENWGHDTCNIFVFKVTMGRCKVIVGDLSGSGKEPVPNYDCHVSQQTPKPDELLHTQVARSQIYLYEYNDDCETVERPRHCLPHAVVEYVKDEKSASSMSSSGYGPKNIQRQSSHGYDRPRTSDGTRFGPRSNSSATVTNSSRTSSTRSSENVQSYNVPVQTSSQPPPRRQSWDVHHSNTEVPTNTQISSHSFSVYRTREDPRMRGRSTSLTADSSSNVQIPSSNIQTDNRQVHDKTSLPGIHTDNSTTSDTMPLQNTHFDYRAVSEATSQMSSLPNFVTSYANTQNVPAIKVGNMNLTLQSFAHTLATNLGTSIAQKVSKGEDGEKSSQNIPKEHNTMPGLHGVSPLITSLQPKGKAEAQHELSTYQAAGDKNSQAKSSHQSQDETYKETLSLHRVDSFGGVVKPFDNVNNQIHAQTLSETEKYEDHLVSQLQEGKSVGGEKIRTVVSLNDKKHSNVSGQDTPMKESYVDMKENRDTKESDKSDSDMSLDTSIDTDLSAIFTIQVEENGTIGAIKAIPSKDDMCSNVSENETSVKKEKETLIHNNDEQILAEKFTMDEDYLSNIPLPDDNNKKADKSVDNSQQKGNVSTSSQCLAKVCASSNENLDTKTFKVTDDLSDVQEKSGISINTSVFKDSNNSLLKENVDVNEFHRGELSNEQESNVSGVQIKKVCMNTDSVNNTSQKEHKDEKEPMKGPDMYDPEIPTFSPEPVLEQMATFSPEPFSEQLSAFSPEPMPEQDLDPGTYYKLKDSSVKKSKSCSDLVEKDNVYNANAHDLVYPSKSDIGVHPATGTAQDVDLRLTKTFSPLDVDMRREQNSQLDQSGSVNLQVEQGKTSVDFQSEPSNSSMNVALEPRNFSADVDLRPLRTNNSVLHDVDLRYSSDSNKMDTDLRITRTFYPSYGVSQPQSGVHSGFQRHEQVYNQNTQQFSNLQSSHGINNYQNMGTRPAYDSYSTQDRRFSDYGNVQRVEEYRTSGSSYKPQISSEQINQQGYSQLQGNSKHGFQNEIPHQDSRNTNIQYERRQGEFQNYSTVSHYGQNDTIAGPVEDQHKNTYGYWKAMQKIQSQQQNVHSTQMSELGNSEGKPVFVESGKLHVDHSSESDSSVGKEKKIKTHLSLADYKARKKQSPGKSPNKNDISATSEAAPVIPNIQNLLQKVKHLDVGNLKDILQTVTVKSHSEDDGDRSFEQNIEPAKETANHYEPTQKGEIQPEVNLGTSNKKLKDKQNESSDYSGRSTTGESSIDISFGSSNSEYGHIEYDYVVDDGSESPRSHCPTPLRDEHSADELSPKKLVSSSSKNIDGGDKFAKSTQNETQTHEHHLKDLDDSKGQKCAEEKLSEHLSKVIKKEPYEVNKELLLKPAPSDDLSFLPIVKSETGHGIVYTTNLIEEKGIPGLTSAQYEFPDVNEVNVQIEDIKQMNEIDVDRSAEDAYSIGSSFGERNKYTTSDSEVSDSSPFKSVEKQNKNHDTINAEEKDRVKKNLSFNRDENKVEKNDVVEKPEPNLTPDTEIKLEWTKDDGQEDSDINVSDNSGTSLSIKISNTYSLAHTRSPIKLKTEFNVSPEKTPTKIKTENSADKPMVVLTLRRDSLSDEDNENDVVKSKNVDGSGGKLNDSQLVMATGSPLMKSTPAKVMFLKPDEPSISNFSPSPSKDSNSSLGVISCEGSYISDNDHSSSLSKFEDDSKVLKDIRRVVLSSNSDSERIKCERSDEPLSEKKPNIKQEFGTSVPMQSRKSLSFEVSNSTLPGQQITIKSEYNSSSGDVQIGRSQEHGNISSHSSNSSVLGSNTSSEKSGQKSKPKTKKVNKDLIGYRTRKRRRKKTKGASKDMDAFSDCSIEILSTTSSEFMDYQEDFETNSNRSSDRRTFTPPASVISDDYTVSRTIADFGLTHWSQAVNNKLFQPKVILKDIHRESTGMMGISGPKSNEGTGSFAESPTKIINDLSVPNADGDYPQQKQDMVKQWLQIARKKIKLTLKPKKAAKQKVITDESGHQVDNKTATAENENVIPVLHGRIATHRQHVSPSKHNRIEAIKMTKKADVDKSVEPSKQKTILSVPSIAKSSNISTETGQSEPTHSAKAIEINKAKLPHPKPVHITTDKGNMSSEGEPSLANQVSESNSVQSSSANISVLPVNVPQKLNVKPINLPLHSTAVTQSPVKSVLKPTPVVPANTVPLIVPKVAAVVCGANSQLISTVSVTAVTSSSVQNAEMSQQFKGSTAQKNLPDIGFKQNMIPSVAGHSQQQLNQQVPASGVLKGNVQHPQPHIPPLQQHVQPLIPARLSIPTHNMSSTSQVPSVQVQVASSINLGHSAPSQMRPLNQNAGFVSNVRSATQQGVMGNQPRIIPLQQTGIVQSVAPNIFTQQAPAVVSNQFNRPPGPIPASPYHNQPGNILPIQQIPAGRPPVPKMQIQQLYNQPSPHVPPVIRNQIPQYPQQTFTSQPPYQAQSIMQPSSTFNQIPVVGQPRPQQHRGQGQPMHQPPANLGHPRPQPPPGQGQPMPQPPSNLGHSVPQPHPGQGQPMSQPPASIGHPRPQPLPGQGMPVPLPPPSLGHPITQPPPILGHSMPTGQGHPRLQQPLGTVHQRPQPHPATFSHQIQCINPQPISTISNQVPQTQISYRGSQRSNLINISSSTIPVITGRQVVTQHNALEGSTAANNHAGSKRPADLLDWFSDKIIPKKRPSLDDSQALSGLQSGHQIQSTCDQYGRPNTPLNLNSENDFISPRTNTTADHFLGVSRQRMCAGTLDTEFTDSYTSDENFSDKNCSFDNLDDKTIDVLSEKQLMIQKALQELEEETSSSVSVDQNVDIKEVKQDDFDTGNKSSNSNEFETSDLEDGEIESESDSENNKSPRSCNVEEETDSRRVEVCDTGLLCVNVSFNDHVKDSQKVDVEKKSQYFDERCSSPGFTSGKEAIPGSRNSLKKKPGISPITYSSTYQNSHLIKKARNQNIQNVAKSWSQMLMVEDNRIERIKGDSINQVVVKNKTVVKKQVIRPQEVKTLGDWAKLETNDSNIESLQKYITVDMSTELSSLSKNRRKTLRKKLQCELQVVKLKISADEKVDKKIEEVKEQEYSVEDKEKIKKLQITEESSKLTKEQLEKELELVRLCIANGWKKDTQNPDVINNNSKQGMSNQTSELQVRQDLQVLETELMTRISGLEIGNIGSVNRRIPKDLLMESEYVDDYSEEGAFLILTCTLSKKIYMKLVKLKEDIQRLSMLLPRFNSIEDKTKIKQLRGQKKNLHTQRRTLMMTCTGLLTKKRVTKIKAKLKFYNRVYNHLKKGLGEATVWNLHYLKEAWTDLEKHEALAVELLKNPLRVAEKSMFPKEQHDIKDSK